MLLGDDRLDNHLAVPDPGVMGAEIAEVGQGVEPVAEDLLVDAEVGGDGFALGGELDCLHRRIPIAFISRFRSLTHGQ